MRIKSNQLWGEEEETGWLKAPGAPNIKQEDKIYKFACQNTPPFYIYHSFVSFLYTFFFFFFFWGWWSERDRHREERQMMEGDPLTVQDRAKEDFQPHQPAKPILLLM